MPDAAFISIESRFWRMLSIRWQREPLNSGAHLSGGRFNPRGVPALYLADAHATAISEFYRLGVRPGTLAGYDVASSAIADLTTADCAPLADDWRVIFAIQNRIPPTWPLAERLIAEGAHGALVPSFQREGATNLVLWRWHRAGTGGEGAAVTLIDPGGDLLP